MAGRVVGAGECGLSGETDLGRLLAGLDPTLDPQSYGFSTAPAPPARLDGLFAAIREDEGWTLIGPGDGWARIALTVHSSLEAVGLTAAISRALTDAGVAANLVAAARHDHLFVPWDRREEALAVLRRLSASNRGG